MSVTVTINKKKNDLSVFSTPQKIGMGALVVVGVTTLGIGTVGIGMAIFGGLSMLLGGGAGTFLWGVGLIAGAKITAFTIEKGVVYAEKSGLLAPLNAPDAPAAAVSTLAPLVPDFNHEAAVTLEKKIAIRPVIKLKSKSNDLGQS